ncbi:MAG: hypothetical protein GY839_04725, partial [candidate division Zixibacteria bacterium]|nr:hypothetical protein [candidate division Zixibacteria bacterium]
SDWNGFETVTFTASDPSLLSSSDAVLFTVTAVNNAPVVSDIPDQIITEGATFATINLDNYVTDIDDLDSDISWSFVGNSELTVSIDVNRVATIGIPDVDWNGNETITFTATDIGLLSDDDLATFEVTAVNDAPVVADIPDQTIDEGLTFATINLDDYVSDVDNLDSEISWIYGGNIELAVSIDIDRIATITIPNINWSGSEIITFTASDPGLLSDNDPSSFIVTAINDAPVVTDIPNQTIAEGSSFTSISLDDYVSDVEDIDADLDWTYSGNSELTVSIDVDRIATITIPNTDWNGDETITFTATDLGLLTGSDPVVFTVNALNDAPIVSDIPDQTLAEGAAFATISLDDFVSDVDNLDSEISWSYGGNSELTVSIDIDRIVTITTPDIDWNGSESISFTATDPGLLNSSDLATFTITAGNDAPVVSDIPDQTFSEGSTFTAINLDDYVTDVDNLDTEISWSFSGNTALSVVIDVDRIATITAPNADWFGSEMVTFTATDPSLLSNSNPATFTLTAINDAPVVADIPAQTVAEGATFTTINLDDYITDVDNLASEMTWGYSGNIELSVSIVNRVAIVGIPDAEWSGAEVIIFVATDPGSLSNFDAAMFTVTAVNDAPIVTDIGNQAIAEGATFTTISLDDFVSDTDNLDSEMSWSFVGNSQLTISLDANRIATISIPTTDWNGSETITFTATDPGALSDADPATFEVTAVNDAPVVANIPDQVIAEGATFTTISLDNYVTDIDNNDTEISWTFLGNTDLTVDITARVATITIPDVNWNGDETITFTATDPGILSDSDPATFTVTAGNDAPVVTDIPNQTLSEGSTFASINLDDYVSDVDNTDAEMIWTYTGNTELSIDITARVATITVPDLDWNGDEIITFRSSDPGGLFDEDVATFTISGINDAPVISDIPNQTVAEGASFATIDLDDYVSDIDNLDSEISWAYGGNTELLVAIDVDHVATITTPDIDWNGDESITFTATDPGLLNVFDAATFTVTAGNDAPIVADIPDQTVAEGLTFTTISLDDYVTDVDNLDSEIDWTFSGNTELTVSIDINRIATIGIPDTDWNGSELITFTATDPTLLSNSNPATFTVTGINDAPVASDIPNQVVAEGASFATINLDDYVTDIDNLASEMAWTFSGNINLSVSIVNRVAIISAPDADWTGAEVITFVVTDPGSLNDLDPAQFTVTAVNDAPILADIPDQTINEGATFVTISLDDFVSDVDNLDSEMSWGFIGQNELTVSIDVNRIVTITIPGTNWNGNETITFTATDPGTLADSDAATFIVSAVNDDPVVSDIPDQTIGEGSTFVTVNLDSYVTDLDNLASDMTWSYANNTDLIVSIDVNRVATISIPDIDWNGFEAITFRATDPGALFDEDVATFTVNAINDAPVVIDIPDQTVDEGATFITINLDDYVSDIDNLDTELSWGYSGQTDLIIDITARIATITIPDINWNGAETITFTATDPGTLSDNDPVLFTVTAINDGPVVADIPDQILAEGATFATINLDDYVDDLDNLDSEISWTAVGNVELTVNIVSRVATITAPDIDWNGSEIITFTATDPGLLSNFDDATFALTAGNDTPVVTDIPDQTIAEGATFVTINLDDYVSDVDNLDTEMSWGFSGQTDLIIDITARVATITIPDVDWNGAEVITFTATDPGLLADSDPATFTVTGVNDDPVLAAIGPQSTTENINLNFVILASDIESTPAFTTSVLPTGATFVDNGDGTGTFDWTPTFLQSGSYPVTFTATDDSSVVDFEVVTITIDEAGNQLPILATIGARSTTENINLNFIISATDIESITALTTSTLPTGATFVDNGDGTGTFDWTPTFLQSGDYPITFTATDDSTATDFEDVTITVIEGGNQLPILAIIGAQSTTENVNLNFVISATDIESTPTFTASTLPTGATFVDNGDGTGTFDWTPTFLQSGDYPITFTATDDSLTTDFEDVTITVIEAGNQLPILAIIGAQSTTENINLNFVISATDIESITALTTSTLPTGATFVDNGDGTGTFDWTPTFLQSGDYPITFTATDDSLTTDFEDITITVIEAGNQLPILAAIGAQFTNEDINLNFVISATDIESTPSLTSTVLPTGATFVDNNDGTGTFNWTPGFLQSGSYPVTFTATDDSLAIDFEDVIITVSEDGNQVPVLTAIGAQSTTEDINLNFVISATDVESTPAFTTSTLPTGATFVDNGDGTGTFDWTPTFLQSGDYPITFTATDDSTATDFEDITITVIEAGNQLPILATIGAQSTTENVNLNFVISATDIESITALTTSTLPTGATFVDNGDGTGT